MKESHYYYFELSLEHITKNKPLLFIIFLIEYYDTFLHLCEASIYLRNYDIVPIDILITKKNTLNIISPLNHLRELIKREPNHYWAFLILAVVLVYYISIKVFLYFKRKFSSNLLNSIIINTIDLCILRLFAFCLIDLIVFWLFLLINQTQLMISFIFFLLIIIVAIVNFMHIQTYYVFSTGHFDYPFTKLTMIYDQFLFAMKIIISFNKNALDILKENNTIIFFLNILLLLYFYFGFGFFAMFYYYSPCYFIYNQILNKEKVFFMLLFSLVSIALLLFNEPTLLLMLLLGCLLLLSFLLTYSIDSIHRCFTYISYASLENQLMFIMNISLLSSSTSSPSYTPYYETKYDNEIKRHYIFCKHCPLCQRLLSDDLVLLRQSLDTYHHLFLDLMAQSMFKTHNKTIVFYRDAYDILTKVYKEANFNYKLQLRFKTLIDKYSKRNNDFVSMNLKYIYSKYWNEMKIPELNHYKLIAIFDEISSQTKEVIGYIKKMFIENISTPNEIITLANKLEQINIKQQKLLNIRDNMQNYSMVLMRIANEELLNAPMNKEDGLIRIEKNYSEDFLQFHYAENRIMIISVDISKKSYVITRTGNEMIRYLNMEYAQMFPKEYRRYAMGMFTGLISNHKESNKEIFEFFIQRNIEGMNYALFKYAFYLTPSLQNSDYCIIGEYSVLVNDIIITQKSININTNAIIKPLLENSGHTHHTLARLTYRNTTITDGNYAYILHWVNQNLKPMLFGTKIDPKQSHQGLSRKSIIFSDMFIKNINSDVYVLKKNETELSLTFCFDFKLKDNYYKVYMAKTKSLNKNKNSNSINDNTDDSGSNKHNRHHIIDDNKSVFWLDDFSSVNTTSTKSNMTSKTLKSRGNRPKYYKHTQSKLYLNRFRKTSNVILFFCVILICYMLATLFIELDLNKSIVQLYNIYTNFRAANRLYYTMISNIIGVICVGDTNSDNCVNYYQLFTAGLIETTDIRMDIFHYIVLENQEKIIEFADRIKLLKLNIHQLNDEYCSNVYNQDFNYSLLSLLNDELYLNNQTTTFSNALGILVNTMMTIILDPETINLPIYGYSTDPYDFSHIYNRKSLSSTQFEYYNAFINYNSYLLTWNSIQMNLYSKIIERLTQFWVLSNAFMVIAYIFHLLLCGILLFYLYSFLSLLIFQIEKIIVKMDLIENKRFYLNKLDILLSLCKLYEENPISQMKKIDNLYQEYFKQLKNNKQTNNTKGNTNTNTSTKEEARGIKKEPQRYKTSIYFTLLKAYFYFVLGVFVYYTALFFVFVLLRNLKIKETILAVNLIEEVSYGDSAGFNGLTLIQLMIIANLTETSIGKTLNYEGNDYFAHTFSTAIDIYYSYIEEQKKTGLMKLTSEVIDLKCENFYSDIDDIIINSIDLKHPDMNIKHELAIVCDTLHFLPYKDPMIIIKALFYNLLQLSKMIKRAPFDVYLGVISKSKIFEIFNTVFLFFQPLRTWINTKIFDTAIEKITNEETVILIVYLVLNNVTELVLLLLLYFFLIKHITKINKNVNRVMCLFKIKHEET